MTWWERRNRELVGPELAGERVPPYLIELLEAVEESYLALATMPGWPDPHADPASPYGRRESTEDEYSRCLDPWKYAVVLDRVEAWVSCLVERGLAEVVELGLPIRPAPADEVGNPDWLLVPHLALGRARRVQPLLAPGLPLVVGSWDATDDRPAGVLLAAGSPAVPIQDVPDCGCDACDDGSDPLLQVVDETLLHVLDGSLRMRVEAGTTSARWSGGGQSSTVYGDDRRARRAVLGPDPHEYAGSPWHPGWPLRQPQVEVRAERPRE